jgi:hypothetical protein
LTACFKAKSSNGAYDKNLTANLSLPNIFALLLRRPKSFVHEIYFSFFYSNVESDFSGGPGPCTTGAGGRQ